MNRARTALLGVIGALAACLLVGTSVGVSAHKAEAAPASYAAPDWFSQKYGLFVHYVPGLTTDKNGVAVNDINQLANAFDAQSFANDIASFGVQYVKFTAWHKGMYPLYPSANMTKWRGAGTSASVDLIGAMIDAVRAKGIAVMLYTHPRDGHDMSAADQTATGWGLGGGTNPIPAPSTFDFTKWNNFINDIYGELLDRYGSRIQGIYLDEGDGTGQGWSVVDYPRLRALIVSKAPGIIIEQNYYGNVYSADVPDHEYFKGAGFSSNDGSTWPADKYRAVSSVVSSLWWTSVPSTTNTTTWSASDIFRYTVLQAGTNVTGGGVAWAGGVYPGGGWESGFASTMQAVSALMAPVRSSIIDTYPSPSWPTVDQSTIGGLPWGVATRSTDNSITYLHVLKPPTGSTLTIPAPADGRTFSAAQLLTDGAPLAFSQSGSSFSVTLPAGRTWNATDTAIALTSPSLAMGAKASASSSVENGAWGAANAVDGSGVSNSSNYGYSSSSSEMTNHAESYTVDLNSAHTIDKVALLPRTDGVNTGYGLPVNYSIDSSADGVTWTTRSSVSGASLSPRSLTAIFTPASARYVRVNATSLRANPNDGGRYRLQFAEMAVGFDGATAGNTTITSVSTHRALQGTGNAFESTTTDNQVIARPPIYVNSEYAWSIADAGGGYVTITNVNRGLRLSGTSVSYRGRTDVNQVSESSTAVNDAQLWMPIAAGNGYVRFQNKQYGMVLHSTYDLWSTYHDIFSVVMVPSSWNTTEQQFKIG